MRVRERTRVVLRVGGEGGGGRMQGNALGRPAVGVGFVVVVHFTVTVTSVTMPISMIGPVTAVRASASTTAITIYSRQAQHRIEGKKTKQIRATGYHREWRLRPSY